MVSDYIHTICTVTINAYILQEQQLHSTCMMIIKITKNTKLFIVFSQNLPTRLDLDQPTFFISGQHCFFTVPKSAVFEKYEDDNKESVLYLRAVGV